MLCGAEQAVTAKSLASSKQAEEGRTEEPEEALWYDA